MRSVLQKLHRKMFSHLHEELTMQRTASVAGRDSQSWPQSARNFRTRMQDH
jgi:hypothetical protein